MAKEIVPNAKNIGKVKTYNVGGTPTPTPVTPTTTGVGKKTYNVGGGPSTPETTASTSKTPDVPGAIINIGQSFLDLLSTPEYFNVGGLTQANIERKKAKAKIQSKLDKQLKALGYDSKTYLPIGLNAEKNALVGATGAASQDFRTLGLTPNAPENAKKAYKLWAAADEQVKGLSSFSLEGAMKNAFAWTRGERSLTGADLIESATGKKPSMGEALATDIMLDPLTYFNGIGAAAKVLGGAKTAGQAALKAGKLAATEGKISKRLVLDSVERNAQKLKPGADTFQQYTKRPLIKENLRTGPRFEKLKNKIDTKFTYETALGDKNVRNVLASALEAGYKAGAARILTKFTAQQISEDLNLETKMAKLAGKKAAKTVKETPQVVVDGVTKDLAPFEMHVNGRTTYVMDDANIIHKFSSQKSAKQFIAEQANAPKVIKPAVKADRPIVDTAPVTPNFSGIRSSDKTIQEQQKALTTIDKIVAKTKGVTAGKSNIASKVNAVLRDATAVKSTVKNLNADIQTGLKNVLSNKKSPLSILAEWRAAGGQFASIANELAKKTVTLKSGDAVTLEKLIGQDFAKASPQLKEQILAHFKDLASAGTATEAQYLAKLTQLVGKDIAQKIAATGVLKGGNFDAKQVKEIIDNLPGLATEKTYKNINEFVTGLRNGDIVDLSAITNILKAIDPEAKLTASVDKALSKEDSYTQLRNIMITSGIQTIEMTSKRLDMLNAEKLFKAQGMALADTAAAYANARLTGVELVSPPVQEAARQSASKRLAQYMGSGQMNDAVGITLRSIARGLDSNLEYMQKEIFASEDVLQGVSSLGDLAARNTQKAYQANTKAALLKQINQSGEARMVGQLLGLIRKRFPSGDTKQIFDTFISHSQIMEDALLSVLGARNIYQKIAKGAKGEKHYIYFTMGDYAKIMKETGAEDLAIRSLVADMSVHGASKFDTLSTIGIGQAIRMTLEQFEKNGSVIKSDIVKALESRAGEQGARSKAFESQVAKLIDAIADHITKPEFIKEVQKVHNTRAAATVEDTINAAESLTDDMYVALVEGWKANRLAGVDNPAARAQLVRDWFNKFAYASGIFNQQSGEQAQAVFQAASRIFVQEGKLKALTDEAETAWLIGSPAKSAGEEANTLYADTMEAINSFFKHSNSDLVAGPGRERLPFPTEASRGKAIDKLTQAKLNYENIINQGKNLTSKAAVNAWNKTFTKAQAKLDEARLEAWKNSVPTQHWDNGKWVPTESYDHAAATLRAAGSKTVTVLDGLAEKTPAVDTVFTAPGYKKLSAEESKKWINNWREQNNIRVDLKTQGIQEEVATKILDDMPSYEALNLTPSELADRLHEAQIHETMLEAVIYVPVYESSVSYKTVKTLPTGIRTGKEMQPMKPVMGKWAATAGRADVQPVLSRMESASMLGMAKLGDVMHTIRKTYKDTLSPEEFSQAFKTALSQSEIPAGMSSAASDLTMHLRNVIETVFGTPETGEIITRGLDPEHLRNSFKRFGIDKNNGFIDVGTLNPSGIVNYIKELPFAEMPDYMKGTPEADIWAKRAEKFAKSGEDPFTALTKVMNAIQFTAYEQRMVSDFSTKFSYKAQGLTMEQALAQGFVKIKGAGSSGTDLSLLLPKAEAGGLYPPYIAEQFMSLNREYNRIFNEKLFERPALNNFVRNAMELQGFLKATQTIFRVGHHITNLIGDSSTAWISGTRDPRDWMRGMQVALKFASEDIKGKWGTNKLDQKFKDLYMTTGQYGHKVTRTAGKKESSVTIAHRNAAGKLVSTDVAIEELYPMLRERNLVMGNIYADDLQGLYDSVLAEASDAVGAKATLAQQKLAKVREVLHNVEEGPGSFSSWYSNIPRIATTIRVIESRTWKNLDEALDAAVTEVNRFHPTIQSLSASERKYIRPIFTYYTWIRGAHYAFIDMALHHTSAAMLFSKAQYNESRDQGFAPQSFGNPWAATNPLPGYVNYSTYAPTKGIGGEPMLFKRSFLLQDVADQWKFSYDLALGIDQNLFKNYDVLAKTVSGQSSIIAKPVTGFLGGNVDPGTGQPSKIDSFATFADAAMQNVGFWTLYKGLGGQTFAQAAGEAKPTTELERKNFINNWLTGQKGQIIMTEANLKNARMEKSQRAKAILEKMKRENQ